MRYLIFISILFSAVSSGNEVKHSDLAQLLTAANEQRLYEHHYWKKLLHYKRTVFGTQSLIDDPDFFLSERGRFDPEAELHETIKAFFHEDQAIAGDAICRFIARYHWLKAELNFNDPLPLETTCKEFNTLFNSIKPKSLTLIFPAAYINSPASMFGHTLLNINTPANSKLLSFAVNYAASSDETNGLLFAFKGIFGLYKGYFSVLPYYEKVQEYADIMQRDIWEYELNLIEAEVINMVRHLWELKGIYSDYYFFNENCSYNLLYLLDVARPALNLHDQFHSWVIPIDTVKMMKKSGLIDSVSYRPSKTTRIKHIAVQLNDAATAAALSVLNEEIGAESILLSDFPLEQKIKILDLAMEMAQYRYAKKDWSKDKYLKIFLEVSKARSTLGKAPEGSYDYAVPVEPEKGHESSRLTAAGGVDENDSFIELGYQPAYHDLLDPEDGFAEGSQIKFLNTIIRHYHSTSKTELERLDIINIISLTPREKFFKPVSWRVRTGFLRKAVTDEKHLLYQLNTGGGFSLENRLTGLHYGLMEMDLQLGGVLEDSYSLGLGFSTGIIKKLSNRQKLHLSARTIFHQLGGKHELFEVSLLHRTKINDRTSMIIELTRRFEFDFYNSIGKLNWSFYF